MIISRPQVKENRGKFLIILNCYRHHNNLVTTYFIKTYVRSTRKLFDKGKTVEALEAKAQAYISFAMCSFPILA